MRKLLFGLFCLFSVMTLVACSTECEECEKCETCEECEVCETCPELPDPEDLTPSPAVTGVVYHWMHGAVLADVTYTVDIKEADDDSVLIVFDTVALVRDLDYELDGSSLTIFGDALETLGLEDGVNNLKFITEHGVVTFVVEVVDDPTGTTIETEEYSYVDFGAAQQQTLTAPIAGAPKLLITEMNVDAGINLYIEVFNNTAEPMNLKGKRIVFGDVAAQNSDLFFNADNDFLANVPYAMSNAAYIYQDDYIIPALSPAIIWILTYEPWIAANPTFNEATDFQDYMFGDAENNLSIAKFKALHGISDETLVFPVRMNYALMNGPHNYDPATGLGSVITKTGTSNVIRGMNSGLTSADRLIQIQEYDTETLFEIDEANTFAPDGATHYRYAPEVINKVEDLYATGVLDKTVILKGGGRESINAFVIRVEYTDAEGNFIGYAKTGVTDPYAIDNYNANKNGYHKFLAESATAIVTAFIYPKITFDGEVATTAKWGSVASLQYTIPAEGGSVMRFLSTQDISEFLTTMYADRKNTAIMVESVFVVSETTFPITTILVPKSTAYPRDYLGDPKQQSGGVVDWYNLYTTRP